MNPNYIVRLGCLLLTLLTAGSALAEPADSVAPNPIRPVQAAYTLSVGSGRLVDTYLSPLRYSGEALSLDYERRQAMRFDPDNWTMRLAGRLEGMKTDNPARNSSLWDLQLDLSWGIMRRWRLPHNITVGAGGSTSLLLGCIYNERNSNNPVAAKAAWTINWTGYAAWQCRIGRLPVTLCYQPTVPLTGAFFSPDYGELYYEIYLGNHSGLAHWAWWGNYRSIDNLLTADLHFGATALRIGFRSNVLSTHVNNITTRIVSCQAVIGISGQWMSYNPKKPVSPHARIISAIY